jgi:hypothetical protein
MRSILLFCALLIPVLSAQEAPPPSGDKPPEPVQAAKDPLAADPEGRKVIQVQVEWIEISHEQLTKLLFMRPKGIADATGLRKEVQAQVDAGTGKILDTQIITGRSGEKATVESVHELVYPTAFEPAEGPNSVTTSDKPEAVPNPENFKSLAGLLTPHTPTEFQTRNVGSTLEIEPGIDDTGTIVDLRFAPDLVWHTGDTVWQERKDILGNPLKMEVPEFYSLRTASALMVKDGTYSLAAVLSPKDQEGHADLGRKVMMFVKCDVLVVR